MELREYANLDYDRERRCGFPEVIFGEGKTAEQICEIASALLKRHDLVLATRVSEEKAAKVLAQIDDAIYMPTPRLLFVDRRESPIRTANVNEALATVAQSRTTGNIIVCCAGTSDLPVAQEAAMTACLMGSHVTLLTDIGVAGVHRTLAHEDELQNARVIVAVAGMEGALPSLIAGLVGVPVVAVPTSVGYGASFGGISALLSMMNSCAGGVSVVNIDNGFGAGQVAHRINSPSWLLDE